MHSTLMLSAFAAAIPLVHGHFTFVRVAHNGEWQAPFQFIRNKTAPFEELHTPDTSDNVRLYNYPTFSSDLSESIRCGRDNLAHAAETEVLKLKAGDELEFVTTAADPEYWLTSTSRWDDCPEGRGYCGNGIKIIHDGPVLAHLSKVPDGLDVHAYDGSGEWTKIYTKGLEILEDRPQKLVHWLPRNDENPPPRFIFKIPKQTPAGQYLLRIDLIWPGLLYNLRGQIVTDGEAQLYPSCAQIEVESEIEGSLPQGIHIPEDVRKKSPGMQMSIEMYRSQKVDAGYVYPGGPLWDGEQLVEDKPPYTN
jgi:hypothetical protein